MKGTSYTFTLKIMGMTESQAGEYTCTLKYDDDSTKALVTDLQSSCKLLTGILVILFFPETVLAVASG